MEKKHLSYFKVENFKRFESLEINDIGQFNLIVGDNNVGKTSLLEALLFDETNYNQFLANLINVLVQVRNIPFQDFSQLDTFDYVSLFAKNKITPIIFKYQLNDKIATLSLQSVTKSDLTEQELQFLSTRNIIHQTSNFLVKITHDNKQELRFSTYNKEPGSYIEYYPMTCFGLSYQHDLINFFSQVSKKNQSYNFLLKELKTLIPDIHSIELSNALIKDFLILAIRETNVEELRPISFYGDGLNKFFRYLLEIYLCEGKRLMIDEIDTGIHYSRMKTNFKSLFGLSKQNNVQLFATTHSKECLQYYKEAIQDLGIQKHARIIKLVEHKNKQVKAYTYNFDEFEHSIDNNNEIR